MNQILLDRNLRGFLFLHVVLVAQRRIQEDLNLSFLVQLCNFRQTIQLFVSVSLYGKRDSNIYCVGYLFTLDTVSIFFQHVLYSGRMTYERCQLPSLLTGVRLSLNSGRGHSMGIRLLGEKYVDELFWREHRYLYSILMQRSSSVEEALGNQVAKIPILWMAQYLLNGILSKQFKGKKGLLFMSSTTQTSTQKNMASNLPTIEANAKLPATCDYFLKGTDGHLVTYSFIMLDLLLHGEDLDLSLKNKDIFCVYICFSCSLIFCHQSGIAISPLTQGHIFQQKMCYSQLMSLKCIGFILCHIAQKHLLIRIVE